MTNRIRNTKTITRKRCLTCHGFCPSGTLSNGLCSDCDTRNSPDAQYQRAFALALASRNAYWRQAVAEGELLPRSQWDRY